MTIFDHPTPATDDTGYQLHLGTVTRVADSAAYVSAPTLAPGFELGPCLSLVPTDLLEPGTHVVVSTMNNGEQQAILGIVGGTTSGGGSGGPVVHVGNAEDADDLDEQSLLYALDYQQLVATLDSGHPAFSPAWATGNLQQQAGLAFPDTFPSIGTDGGAVYNYAAVGDLVYADLSISFAGDGVGDGADGSWLIPYPAGLSPDRYTGHYYIGTGAIWSPSTSQMFQLIASAYDDDHFIVYLGATGNNLDESFAVSDGVDVVLTLLYRHDDGI